jgi:hypothetical protein
LISEIPKIVKASWVALLPDLKQKVLASFLFLFLASLPLIVHHGHVRKDHFSAHWDPADLGSCDVIEFNQTFPNFMDHI